MSDAMRERASAFDGRSPCDDASVRRALGTLDRRGFLRLAGALAAAGVLPTACSAPAPLAPPPGLALVHLTPRTYAVFQAATRRLLGPAAARLVDARTIDPARTADAWLARAPELAAPLRQGLLVLELAPWPLLPKWRPFTALDDTAQDRVLLHLAEAGADWKRALFAGVKSFACLAFYAAPESRAISRYPGPFGGAGGAGIAAAMTLDADDEGALP